MSIAIEDIIQEECGSEALNILEIMAYLASNGIYIKEIFIKLIADNERKLWNAVGLLNRYHIINLKAGIANIHELVQMLTRLKLEKEGQEEGVLKKALGLINVSDVMQDNTIHGASVWEHASKYGRLIDDFYFDSTYGEYRVTPLHLLAENGNDEAIEAILTHIEGKYSDKFSRAVNARCEYGITPLYVAVGRGWLNIVQYLIDKGANIDARDYFYRTPLYWAVQYGELDVVKYLVSKGANIDTEDYFDLPPVYWAIDSENFNIAEYLIKEKGIDISARCSNGKTILHEIIRFAKLNSVKYLFGKGIDINIKDKYGNTPLHWAAIKERIDVVRYSVEQGADVNAKGDDDLTPLHWAILYADLKVVKYLIKRGANIDAEDKHGCTPLHLITKNNRLLWGGDLREMLGKTEYLIEKGANVNSKGKDGNTSLHYAAMKGKADIAKILLKYNANVNAKNNDGMTALHYATDGNHQELVKLLLAHNAKVYLKVFK